MTQAQSTELRTRRKRCIASGLQTTLRPRFVRGLLFTTKHCLTLRAHQGSARGRGFMKRHISAAAIQTYLGLTNATITASQILAGFLCCVVSFTKSCFCFLFREAMSPYFLSDDRSSEQCPLSPVSGTCNPPRSGSRQPPSGTSPGQTAPTS